MKEYVSEEGGLWLFHDPEAMALSLRKEDRIVATLMSVAELLECNYNDLIFVNYGGQGLIYMYKTITNEKLCIKLPFYNLYENDQDKENAILYEAKTLMKFNNNDNSFFPRLFNYCDKGKYLIRRFVEGDTLYDLLKLLDLKQRIDLLYLEREFVKGVIKEFYETTNYKFLISDIKIKNIIVNLPKNEMKLIDLGNCKKIENLRDYSFNRKKNKLGSGRFLHWPPELFFYNKDKCSYKSDYFAFGVLAYYTIFLEYPYSNKVYGNYKDVLNSYFKEYEKVVMKLENFATENATIDEIINEIIFSLHPDATRRLD